MTQSKSSVKFYAGTDEERMPGPLLENSLDVTRIYIL